MFLFVFSQELRMFSLQRHLNMKNLGFCVLVHEVINSTCEKEAVQLVASVST